MEQGRPRVLTFVALGGEGKTSLIAKWAVDAMLAKGLPGCDAAFAWSFYSQGTREQVAASSDLFLKDALTFFASGTKEEVEEIKAFAASPAGAFEKLPRSPAERTPRFVSSFSSPTSSPSTALSPSVFFVNTNDSQPQEPPAPLPEPRRTGFCRSPWILAIVLFALSLTLYTRHNDFPFSYHPDEGGKVGQIILGSRNFHHPLLLLSVTDIVSRAAFIPRTPQAIVETGRWVSAAFAACTVVTLALLAWRCYGAAVGWCAGVAVAMQADLFETAHYLKEDPALAFGLALSLLAAHLWWRTPSRRTLRFFAIACGLAAAGKYVGIIALVFALPLVIWHRAAEPALNRRARLRRFAFVFVLTFLVCNLPFFAGKISSPFRSISHEVHAVASENRGIIRKVPHGEYLSMLRKDLPLPVALLAGFYALALVVTARRRTAPEWVGVLLPLTYFAIISCSQKAAGRYLLPVSTLLPLLATLGAVEMARFIRAKDTRFPQVSGPLVFALLIGWIIWSEKSPLRTNFAGFQHDDPTAVAEWIKANLPPDAIIAEDHRVSLSPVKADGLSTAARVPQKVLDASSAPDLGSVDELLAKGVTHIAVCRMSYSRYFNDEIEVQASSKTGHDKRRVFYERVFRQGTLLKEWPRGTISYLQPGIKLYRLPTVASTQPPPN